VYDGKVALHADDNQDENGGRVAQGVDKLVHAAEELAKDPAERT